MTSWSRAGRELLQRSWSGHVITACEECKIQDAGQISRCDWVSLRNMLRARPLATRLPVHRAVVLTSLPLPVDTHLFSLFVFLIKPAPPVALGNSPARPRLHRAPLATPVALCIVSAKIWQMCHATGLPGAQAFLLFCLVVVVMAYCFLCSHCSWSDRNELHKERRGAGGGEGFYTATLPVPQCCAHTPAGSRLNPAPHAPCCDEVGIKRKGARLMHTI